MKGILKVLEFFGSVIFSITIVVVFILLKINALTITRIDTFIVTLATVSITIVGFMIALIGILIGLIHSDIIKKIQLTGKVSSFYGLLIQPLIYSILLLIYSFWLMFSLDDTGQILNLNFYILLLLSSLFVISMLQIAIYINLVFYNILNEKKPKNIESEVTKMTNRTNKPKIT